jgi:hypothetical protein
MRKLALECPRQDDPAQPGSEIRTMQIPHAVQVPTQPINDAIGQHDTPILLALPAPNGDLASLKIDVFHPQFETLMKSQTTSVQECSNQPRNTAQVRKHHSYLGHRQHDGQPHRRLSPRHLRDRADLLSQDFAIQKEHRAQRLVLRRRAHLAHRRKPREKCTDLANAHVLRMPLLVKQDEPPDPRDVDLFGATAVVADTDRMANAIE